MKTPYRTGFLIVAAVTLFASGPAAAQDRRGLDGDSPRMKAINLHPSPALLDYQAVMMPVQRALMGAYYAGICQLRSEAYFRRFQQASIEISRIEATKRNLSNDEIVYADRTAKEIMVREDAEAGFGDLEKRCRDLSPKLPALDLMERNLTGNYH